MNSPVGGGEVAPGTADPLDRRRAVVRWALGASWVWLVPLAGVAFVGGYLSLLFTSFAAEALDGEVTAWVILVAFGRPALAILSAAVAGLCTTLVMARWMSRTAPMARFSPWVIGLATAALGAAAAVIVFWAAMAAVDTVGSQSDTPASGSAEPQVRATSLTAASPA